MIMPRLTEGILLSHPELVGEGENNSNVAIKNPAADYFDRQLTISTEYYLSSQTDLMNSVMRLR